MEITHRGCNAPSTKTRIETMAGNVVQLSAGPICRPDWAFCGLSAKTVNSFIPLSYLTAFGVFHDGKKWVIRIGTLTFNPDNQRVVIDKIVTSLDLDRVLSDIPWDNSANYSLRVQTEAQAFIAAQAIQKYGAIDRPREPIFPSIWPAYSYRLYFSLFDDYQDELIDEFYDDAYQELKTKGFSCIYQGTLNIKYETSPNNNGLVCMLDCVCGEVCYAVCAPELAIRPSWIDDGHWHDVRSLFPMISARSPEDIDPDDLVFNYLKSRSRFVAEPILLRSEDDRNYQAFNCWTSFPIDVWNRFPEQLQNQVHHFFAFAANDFSFLVGNGGRCGPLDSIFIGEGRDGLPWDLTGLVTGK
jgi:hypothetical protein